MNKPIYTGYIWLYVIHGVTLKFNDTDCVVMVMECVMPATVKVFLCMTIASLMPTVVVLDLLELLWFDLLSMLCSTCIAVQHI